jgi:hypothetical protein
MSRLRGDEATLYERYARRLERAVARALGADPWSAPVLLDT